MLCQSADPTVCNRTKAAEHIANMGIQYGYADIWIYVLDKAIQADQKQSIKYFINIDTHVPITQQFGGSAVIEFSVYNIETDTNIWPWKQT